jgi:carbonic anhydrase/acetyltransferase-like protein (isoleucine patch superfamily)
MDSRTDAERLCEHLDQLNRWPSWDDAALAGVELVDHEYDNGWAEPKGWSSPQAVIHLADGSAVYPAETGWQILDDARAGVEVQSGAMRRVHNPGVHHTVRRHPDAWIDPTARVEAGAVLAARAWIGPHAHVGRAAHVGGGAWVGPGVFVGSRSIVRGGCHISPGAVIGAGSDIGSTSQIGAGARLAQRSALHAFSAVTAGDLSTGRPFVTRRMSRWHASQLAHMVDRLASMNREH